MSYKTNISIQEHQRKVVQNKYIDTRTPKKRRTKQIYRYKNTKETSYKTNISIQEHQRNVVQNKYIDTKTPKKSRTKQIYRYKNTKEKSYKTNAALLYNKICKQKT